MPELTAEAVLAKHRELWDLPTLYRLHPEMTDWLSQRIALDSDMIFNVVVVDTLTRRVTYTNQPDRRVAVEQWLVSQITE